MRKNMLIMRKTRWIMPKFKQFITLIVVPFQFIYMYMLLCELLSEDPSSSLSL